jgi:hypothetical protein
MCAYILFHRQRTGIQDMNSYRTKTDAELNFIMKDASEAAQNMRGFDPVAEAKYLDQINDAATELARRGHAKPSKSQRAYDAGWQSVTDQPVDCVTRERTLAALEESVAAFRCGARDAWLATRC